VRVRFGCGFRAGVTFIRTVFRTFDYQETIVHCFLVVNVDLRNDIFEQAFFVAGVPSFFRSDDDVCARRAADSAYNFAMLVADRPNVFSGTLASPSTIVGLSWGSALLMDEGSVCIDFLYDGTWRAEWIDKGKLISCSGSRIETITTLGLPLTFKRRPETNTHLSPEP
jgi:hypothetical protein